MDVVLEGQLSADWSISKVLQSISKLSNVELGVLRIASPSAGINGRLALARGRFVVGARITDSETAGYDALRRLMEVQEGNFAFLDSAGQAPSDMDQSLHIGVDKLLEALPHLPESVAELFDEKALLDEVFGEVPVAAATKRTTAEIRPAAEVQPQRSAPPPAGWNIFKPLLGESDSTKPLLAGATRSNYSLGDARTTFGRLRAFNDKLGTRGTAFWSGLAILLIIICLAVGGTMFTSYNAENPAQQNQR